MLNNLLIMKKLNLKKNSYLLIVFCFISTMSFSNSLVHLDSLALAKVKTIYYYPLRSIFAYGYKDVRRNQLPPRSEVGRHEDPDRSPDEMAVADSTLAKPLQGMRGR